MGQGSATGDWTSSAAIPIAHLPSVPGYVLVSELGRGGMGVVYRALQAGSNRPVALKLIRDGALAGPQDLARFRIEAASAARVRHPNVVEILEVGEYQGRPYYAMELVEGGSLEHWLGGRPQPPRPAAELVRTLARVVHHAHTLQVVHRDLKPANILLQTSRESAPGVGHDTVLTAAAPWRDATPKITDFGLAKRLDSNSTAWTRDGVVLGTAAYMAPEQAAGRSGEIGPSVDVYALGVILYELLTGRPPFHAATWNLTLQQVLNEEPTPPLRLQPDVPRDLETICLKCLEKAPAQRYASAAELADDLTRFLEGQPVAAEPHGQAERLARWAARDGYQIMAEIGKSPRSIVYRVLHGPLRQAAALKVFPAWPGTREEWEERLRLAAARWATLAHPRVLAVQRTGWFDNRPYVLADYLPHGSLADQSAPSPDRASAGRALERIRQTLRMVEQLAEVVSYLQRQGVVHGNLKPSNVLLAADGVPLIADFRAIGGLFQGPLPEGDADAAGLGYLTPESVQAPDAEPRFFTDLYGLGLILYELLAGRPAFAGVTARATLDQVLTHEPTPPSAFNDQVTPALDAICLRCLHKNPWRRYSRAYDLLSQLQHTRMKLDGQAGSVGRGTARRQPTTRGHA